MGLPSTILTQIVLTSVVLGSLKHSGVIKVDTEQIGDPTVRSIFKQAISLGETVAVKSKELYHDIVKS
ncbi:hypothetical protein QBZ16_001692 [Prototheca wickerhamii]|uniref:Uncharacterized protein n=1 Tax=Prototheca wickerhamii TaxID=3111 RepID=A0AAD9MFV7_PROWI|nr:hypothetical protein QBZ16_001692 [Prototheca wickerhamii]